MTLEVKDLMIIQEVNEAFVVYIYNGWVQQPGSILVMVTSVMGVMKMRTIAPTRGFESITPFTVQMLVC